MTNVQDDNKLRAIAEATDLATKSEGFRAKPYQDTGGVWGIGYGSTRDFQAMKVTATTPPVTLAQARWLMSRDLDNAFAEIILDVHVALTPEQHAALADLIYNIGIGAFRSSTLLRLLNAGDYLGAARQFDLWDHVGAAVVAGLLRRRQAETDYFMNKAST